MGRVKIQEAEKLLVSGEATIHSPTLQLWGPGGESPQTHVAGVLKGGGREERENTLFLCSPGIIWIWGRPSAF